MPHRQTRTQIATAATPLGPIRVELIGGELAAVDFAPMTGPADRAASAVAERIAQLIARPDRPVDLPPLRIAGTPFQRTVWDALRGITPGQPITYGELARRIGRPRAVRAAASACGRNRLAVVIPCHRVIAADGSLGGFRWGLDRKRALLDRERGA